jgi:hypothetical protein
MVFDDESKTMTFPLTECGRNSWRRKRFLTKDEIVQAIDEWDFNNNYDINIKNIVCDKLGPAFAQNLFYNPFDKNGIISILSEISLSHGIIYVGSTPTQYNCIGVAETPNHQTNIDADVIDAIVKRIGGGGNGI